MHYYRNILFGRFEAETPSQQKAEDEALIV